MIKCEENRKHTLTLKTSRLWTKDKLKASLQGSQASDLISQCFWTEIIQIDSDKDYDYHLLKVSELRTPKTLKSRQVVKTFFELYSSLITLYIKPLTKRLNSSVNDWLIRQKYKSKSTFYVQHCTLYQGSFSHPIILTNFLLQAPL